MDDIADFLNDNDFSVVANSITSQNNIMRKSHLDIYEANSCLKSHVLHWIQAFKAREGRDPYIVEILEHTAFVVESLSLSKGGRAMKKLGEVMTRQMQVADKQKRGDSGND